MNSTGRTGSQPAEAAMLLAHSAAIAVSPTPKAQCFMFLSRSDYVRRSSPTLLSTYLDQPVRILPFWRLLRDSVRARAGAGRFQGSVGLKSRQAHLSTNCGLQVNAVGRLSSSPRERLLVERGPRHFGMQYASVQGLVQDCRPGRMAAKAVYVCQIPQATGSCAARSCRLRRNMSEVRAPEKRPPEIRRPGSPQPG